MDKLPIEVLVQVLSYLPPSDRLKSALVCKRWANALCFSPLLRDVRLAISGEYDYAGMEAAEAVVLRSRREHRNMKISCVRALEYNAQFWMRIGWTLRELEFEDCTYSASVFVEILRACPKLESFKMKLSAFQSSGGFNNARLSSKEAYGAIGYCGTLRALELQGGLSFGDCQLKKILLNNPGLEELKLDDCESLTDEGLAPILQLEKLRKLDLSRCWSRVTTEFLCRLGTISSLQDIKIGDGAESLDESSLRSIASLPNLHTLQAECFDTGSTCAEVILENSENLRDLTLLGFGYLNETDSETIRKFKKLRTLRLRDVWNLRDSVVEEGVTSSDLESLELYQCSLTNVDLENISARHSRLKHIMLCACGHVTDVGVISLLQREPRLETLSLYSMNVSGKFFGRLGELCPRLRRLNIGFEETPFPDAHFWDAVELFKTQRPAVRVEPLGYAEPPTIGVRRFWWCQTR